MLSTLISIEVKHQIRLFEVASIYEKLSDGYKERQILSGVLYGSAHNLNSGA